MDTSYIIAKSIYFLIAVLCAGLISFACTPPIRVLAFKIGAVDIPKDNRRMHNHPIPLIGGLAVFAGFFISSLIFCDVTKELAAILIGGIIIVFTGVMDDIHPLNPFVKLAMQIIVAIIVVLNGICIEYVNIFGNYIIFNALKYPITVIWIVGLTNAINLIDGLDGLACGISAICSASIFLVVLLMGDYNSALITALLTASCIGFLPFNKHPARIFMGDTGALFLGYTLAVISVNGVFKLHTILSFIIPISIFALPILDTAAAFIRRILKGKSPFSADRGHLHHKLVDMGFTQKESVRILYAICSLFGLVAVVFTDVLFASSKLYKALIVLGVAIAIFYLNYIIMKNPITRVRSGLFEEEKTPKEKHELIRTEIAKMKKRYKRKNQTAVKASDDETNDSSENKESDKTGD